MLMVSLGGAGDGEAEEDGAEVAGKTEEDVAVGGVEDFRPLLRALRALMDLTEAGEAAAAEGLRSSAAADVAAVVDLATGELGEEQKSRRGADLVAMIINTAVGWRRGRLYWRTWRETRRC